MDRLRANLNKQHPRASLLDEGRQLNNRLYWHGEPLDVLEAAMQGWWRRVSHTKGVNPKDPDFLAMKAKNTEGLTKVRSIYTLQRIATTLPKLHAASVVRRLSGFSANDSMKLDRVRAAWKQATPDMYMHIVSKGKYDRSLQFYGAVFTDPSQYTNSHPWPAKVGEAPWHVGFKNARATIHVRKNLRVPTGTPALIWEPWGDDEAIVVTADGGRYLAKLRGKTRAGEVYLTVQPGLPKGKWPKPLADNRYDRREIQQLDKAGELKAGTYAGIKATIEASEACTKRIWDAAQPAFRKIKRARQRASVRRERIAQLRRTLRKRESTRCGSFLKKLKRQVDPVVKTRAKRRLKLYAQVRKDVQRKTAAR